MPRQRVIQLEELENGYVVRLFDKERTSTYHTTLDRALASMRAYLTAPPPPAEDTTSSLQPIIRRPEDPTTALERKSRSGEYTATESFARTRWQRPTQ